MPNTTFDLLALAKRHADAHGLPVALVAAIASYESSSNPAAWNPEPKYRWLWNVKLNKPFRTLTSAEISAASPPKDFPCLVGDRDQEWWAQRASWGLMQVMGACAREHGCREPYLTMLVRDENLGMEFGCRVLAALRDRFLKAFGWRGVVAGYNAGTPVLVGQGVFANQVYVDRIDTTLTRLGMEWPR